MRLRLYRLRLPFKLSVDHSLARRKMTEGLIVLWEKEGLIGLGEGCPREYVTGEAPLQAYRVAQRLARLIIQEGISSPSGLDQAVRSLGLEAFPSVICAFELALLDLMGQARNLPLWGLFSPEPRNLEFVYSLVLPFTTPQTFTFFVEAAQKWQLRDIKVKVAPGSEEVVRRIRQELPSCRLRLDANGSFEGSEAVEFLRRLQAEKIVAFEQPCPREDLKGLHEVASSRLAPVIADESLVDLNDALRLIDHKACQIFNLRLSKCAGLRRTLALWALARSAGLRVQIGCHVGETGILSMAGRHLASLIDEVVFLEGSYSPWLLEEDLVTETVAFGLGGKASPPSRPGLGLTLREEVLSTFGEKLGVFSKKRSVGPP